MPKSNGSDTAAARLSRERQIVQEVCDFWTQKGAELARRKERIRSLEAEVGNGVRLEDRDLLEAKIGRLEGHLDAMYAELLPCAKRSRPPARAREGLLRSNRNGDDGLLGIAHRQSQDALCECLRAFKERAGGSSYRYYDVVRNAFAGPDSQLEETLRATHRAHVMEPGSSQAARPGDLVLIGELPLGEGFPVEFQGLDPHSLDPGWARRVEGVLCSPDVVSVLFGKTWKKRDGAGPMKAAQEADGQLTGCSARTAIRRVQGARWGRRKTVPPPAND